MQTVLITGASGLIGSKLAEVLGGRYALLTPSSTELNLTTAQAVLNYFTTHRPDFVVHLAAYTDVTGAWNQRGDKSGAAYQINVVGTQNISAASAAVGAHLIHTSTAYVFDGTKDGLYVESDPVSPIEWYGQTKAEAEEVVQKSPSPWTILRIDQPFRLDPFSKLDVAHRIMKGLREGTLYPQFTDHFFGPTLIEDFCKVVEWVIRTKTTGLFHASSGERWTDYDFAVAINEALGLGATVQKGSLVEFNKTQTRPYQKNTAMSAELLKGMVDFEMRGVKETLGILVYNYQ